jgi:hypothetical protein
MTVYWVVWDAAAHWIVDRLEREGALPAVRRLRAAGARAAARPPTPNCQTPTCLATLFTGTMPQEHGVTGFTVPGGLADPVEAHRSGFLPGFPARPPVWRLAQAHGRRCAFVHVPWVFDADGAVGPGVDAAIEAYSAQLADSDVLTLLPDARQQWPAGGEDVEVIPTSGGARLVTRAGIHDLDAGQGWVPVRQREGVGFWARVLTTNGGASDPGPLLVRTGVWSTRVAGANRRLVERLAATTPFAGKGIGSLYRTGRFGPRLVDGGDGSAEEIFVSSLACVYRSFADAVDAVLDDHDADLVVIYLPVTDDVGHEFAGVCDPVSAAYRPDVADAIWAQVRRCYSWVDALLDRVLDRAGVHAGRATADLVVLSADHGIVGSAYLVHLNEALIRAGLVAIGADGQLDPRGSAVVYHPANNGTLRVNHDELPGGLVPKEQSGALLRKAMGALTAIAPPGAPLSANQPVVTGFLDKQGRSLPPDSVGEHDDTAYVLLHDDYQPTAAVDGGPVVRPMRKSAAHVVNTGTSRLYATFAVAGAGIAEGVNLGLADNRLGAELVLRHLAPRGKEWVALRRANVATFLQRRGLDADWLAGFMRDRVGAGQLLLTSSPVHGLANATSDLDFIRIQDEPIEGPRISTKIFENGHHLEVTSFSRAELQGSLAALAALAKQPPAEMVAGFRAFDKQLEPRRKQTERVVNGITLEGDLPYIDNLATLSRVWSHASLHTAIEQTGHLCLAEAAGETRGRVGYAVNVVLHLADALLSMTGDVYTTRKWYLLRWARAALATTAGDPRVRSVAAEVDALRAELPAALARPEARLAPRYVEVVAHAAQLIAAARRVVVTAGIDDDVQYHDYLPGAGLLTGPRSSLLMPGRSALASVALPLGELPGLDAERAAALLRAIRAALGRLRVAYDEADDPAAVTV